MTRNIYTFRIAYQSEEQLKHLQEQGADPSSLVLETLPDGEPTFKTLYALADTEAKALRKVEAYVANVTYHDLIDGKTL